MYKINAICLLYSVLALLVASTVFSFHLYESRGWPGKSSTGAKREGVLFASFGESHGYEVITLREVSMWLSEPDNGFWYIDIRSPSEHENLYAPSGSVNVPAFLTQDDWRDRNAEWVLDDEFIGIMDGFYGKDAKFMIGVQANERQHQACKQLAEAGFKNVYMVMESRGF